MIVLNGTHGGLYVKHSFVGPKLQTWVQPFRSDIKVYASWQIDGPGLKIPADHRPGPKKDHSGLLLPAFQSTKSSTWIQESTHVFVRVEADAPHR